MLGYVADTKMSFAGVDGEAAVAKTAAAAGTVETGIVGIDADHHVLDLETEIENVKRRRRATEAQQSTCRKVQVTRRQNVS